MLLAIVFGICLVSLPGNCPTSQKDKDDIAVRLTGVWVVTAETVNGSVSTSEEIKGLSVVVKENNIIFRGTAVQGEATWSVDTSKRPCHIDFTFTNEPLKGEKRSGIVKLDGDTLTLCIDTTGKSRPERFESPAGSKFLLHVHRREKKEK